MENFFGCEDGESDEEERGREKLKITLDSRVWNQMCLRLSSPARFVPKNFFQGVRLVRQLVPRSITSRIINCDLLKTRWIPLVSFYNPFRHARTVRFLRMIPKYNEWHDHIEERSRSTLSGYNAVSQCGVQMVSPYLFLCQGSVIGYQHNQRNGYWSAIDKYKLRKLVFSLNNSRRISWL